MRRKVLDHSVFRELGVLCAPQSMPDLFKVRWEHDVTIVSCHGDIVFGGDTADLSTNVRNLMEAGRRIVLDLSGVKHVDSYGIGVLFSIYTSSVTAGATLVLSGISESVRKMLEQASLVSMVKVYGSDADAVEALAVKKPLAEHRH